MFAELMHILLSSCYYFPKKALKFSEFCFEFCSLLLQVNLFLLQKVLAMAYTLVLLANKARLKRLSLPLVFILSLARLLTLLTPPIKWVTSKR